MSFTRAQQGQFRKLVAEAWTSFRPGAKKCTKRCGECDFCAWYEATLFEATGNRSTSECDHRDDFNLAMSEFEVASGSGIYWSMKLHRADRERALYALREFAGRHGFGEEYLVAMARKKYEAKGGFPGMEGLVFEHIVALIARLKQVVRERRNEPAAAGEDHPF